MRKKIVFLPYDMDTAVGTNNEGALVFGYNLEDIDQTASGADVFNGQQSVLWKNVRAAFLPELRSMYQSLRSTGELSYDRVETAFRKHQAAWPEAVFNEDAWFKYLAPLVEKGNAAYLSMLQGSKAEQRRWWLYNRFRYIDSKYNAGDSLTDVITVRGYAKADITVTPYADIYPTVKYGSYLVQVRGAHGVSSLLECPLDNVNGDQWGGRAPAGVPPDPAAQQVGEVRAAVREACRLCQDSARWRYGIPFQVWGDLVSPQLRAAKASSLSRQK